MTCAWLDATISVTRVTRQEHLLSREIVFKKHEDEVYPASHQKSNPQQQNNMDQTPGTEGRKTIENRKQPGNCKTKTTKFTNDSNSVIKAVKAFAKIIKFSRKQTHRKSTNKNTDRKWNKDRLNEFGNTKRRCWNFRV